MGRCALFAKKKSQLIMKFSATQPSNTCHFSVWLKRSIFQLSVLPVVSWKFVHRPSYVRLLNSSSAWFCFFGSRSFFFSFDSFAGEYTAVHQLITQAFGTSSQIWGWSKRFLHCYSENPPSSSRAIAPGNLRPDFFFIWHVMFRISLHFCNFCTHLSSGSDACDPVSSNFVTNPPLWSTN